MDENTVKMINVLLLCQHTSPHLYHVVTFLIFH